MTPDQELASLRLEDCTEIVDHGDLAHKLQVVEAARVGDESPPLLRLRQALLLHEAGLNLGLLAQRDQRQIGYPDRSYKILTELAAIPDLPPEIRPWIDSFRASALALSGGEKGKLGLLSQAFELFDRAVREHDHASYLPRYLRGSVAENLPRILWRKRRWARIDFDELLRRVEADPSFMPDNVKSFTYWAWAKKFCGDRGKRPKAEQLLKEAMRLDPEKKAGFARASELLQRLQAG